MSEHKSADAAPDTKLSQITRKVAQWVILGLVAFTCIMAAIRKFG